MAEAHRADVRALAGWAARILGPDTAYLRLTAVYGIAISLLSLATPISVQLLINSVANTALPAPLFTLAAVLFLLLLLAGVLSAFRIHLMALFERRLFARVVAEITMRAVRAQDPFFGDARRSDLFNRFFDLLKVQKAMPSLLIGGFTIVLQSAIGLVVTSFYHPFFLAFNALLVLVLLGIWRLWSNGAVRTAVEMSHRKHETARWLEGLGASDGYYQSSRSLPLALDKSEAMTATYIAAHRSHFRYTFAQTLALLFTYAAASAALLALGGWLIIQEELSIGQLVAAELILSSVFYGIAQLGGYLEVLYDLASGLEELCHFWAIPLQKPPPRQTAAAAADGDLELRGVELHGRRFDLAIHAGRRIAAMGDPGAERTLAMLLRRHNAPERGLVLLGGSDLGAFDAERLRSDILVLDRPTIVETSIRDYLGLAAPDAVAEQVAALERVGLARRITELPDGLDTILAPSGWPLSTAELMAMKLAAALLARPRLLLLSSLYDVLPPQQVERALAELKARGVTVLQFTQRPQGLQPDGWLWVGRTRQSPCPDLQSLLSAAAAEEASDVAAA